MEKKDKYIFLGAIFLVLFQTIFVAFAVMYDFLSIYALLTSIAIIYCLLIAMVSQLEDADEKTKPSIQCEPLPSYADIVPLSANKPLQQKDTEWQEQIEVPESIIENK